MLTSIGHGGAIEDLPFQISNFARVPLVPGLYTHTHLTSSRRAYSTFTVCALLRLTSYSYVLAQQEV